MGACECVCIYVKQYFFNIHIDFFSCLENIHIRKCGYGCEYEWERWFACESERKYEFGC